MALGSFPTQSLMLFSVKLGLKATLRHSELLWKERVRKNGSPIRKLGALLQEGRVMLDGGQPLLKNLTLLSLGNRYLNGVQVANAERRSVS